jgi:hypothetical protein
MRSRKRPDKPKESTLLSVDVNLPLVLGHLPDIALLPALGVPEVPVFMVEHVSKEGKPLPLLKAASPPISSYFTH